MFLIFQRSNSNHLISRLHVLNGTGLMNESNSTINVPPTNVQNKDGTDCDCWEYCVARLEPWLILTIARNWVLLQRNKASLWFGKRTRIDGIVLSHSFKISGPGYYDFLVEIVVAFSSNNNTPPKKCSKNTPWNTLLIFTAPKMKKIPVNSNTKVCSCSRTECHIF